MTINFYIDTKKAKPDQILFLYIRGIGNGRTIKISTGERIPPKHWDKVKQHAKKSYTGHPEFNERLANIKADVLKIRRDLLNDGQQNSPEAFRVALLKYFNKDTTKVLTFFEAFDLHIASKKATIAPQTVKKFEVLKNHLLRYQTHSKSKITFHSLDLFFFENFNNYLCTQRKLLNNSASKLISIFKIFLNWACDRNIHFNQEFKKYRCKETKNEVIYLTEAELLLLFNLDLTQKQSLAKVRDVFCFACFTGARYSDVSKLTRDDIHGNEWYLRTKKTKDVLIIPLNPYALEILDRHKKEEKPLPVISNQKTNEYLKELCKEAKIETPQRIVKFRGAERIETVHPKYELIGTHSARRTFITLSLEKGMRAETVMSITGHTNYRTMQKYVKITDKVKLTEMASVWHKN